MGNVSKSERSKQSGLDDYTLFVMGLDRVFDWHSQKRNRGDVSVAWKPLTLIGGMILNGNAQCKHRSFARNPDYFDHALIDD